MFNTSDLFVNYKKKCGKVSHDFIIAVIEDLTLKK